MIKLKDLLNEGKKSKDDAGVRLVMAINNNVDSISELVNREKKDPKEVMSAFATALLNSVKGVLKHNYKPHPADSSNADKLNADNLNDNNNDCSCECSNDQYANRINKDDRLRDIKLEEINMKKGLLMNINHE